MKLRTLSSLFFLLFANIACAANAIEITASDGADLDHFGASVAASGGLLVVGAPDADINGNTEQGAAYVFEWQQDHWAEIAKLVADDGHVDDQFGFDVAIDGNTVVVGALNAWVDGQPKEGAAYVFTATESGWQQRAKLVAGDGLTLEQFGRSVAIDGNTIVVGSPETQHVVEAGARLENGAVFVFERQADSGAWAQTAKVQPEFWEWTMRFGFDVDISGDTLVAGMPGAADGTGGMVVFARDPADGSWTQDTVFAQLGMSMYPEYGTAVAIDGSRALIAAPYEEDWVLEQYYGAGYVMTVENGTNGWERNGGMGADMAAMNDNFGYDVAMSAGLVAIGRPGAGKSYLFDPVQGNEAIREFSLPDVYEGFGESVALSSNTMFTGFPDARVNDGAERGAVYAERFKGDDETADDGDGSDASSGDTDNGAGDDDSPADDGNTADGGDSADTGSDGSGEALMAAEQTGEETEVGVGSAGILFFLLPAVAGFARRRRTLTS